MKGQSASVRTDRGDHFSCSMSAVLLARVEAFGGTEAVREVLRVAGSRGTLEYLFDITNWIAYDEAVALWRAGARLGASIGRAVFPIDAGDADGLLRAADAAMFAVKRGSRDRVLDPARGI